MLLMLHTDQYVNNYYGLLLLIITPTRTIIPTMMIAMPAGIAERVDITEFCNGIITGNDARATADVFDLNER